MLSLTSDFRQGTGSAEPYLRFMAMTGFTHVHWCHQWNTDFVYLDGEIMEIERWLRLHNLRLLDLHGSEGVEKCWTSPVAYEREAGIELVRNRLRMTARLGGDCVVMHLDAEPEDSGENRAFWTRVRATLDALEPDARSLGVRIALENLEPSNFPTITRVFAEYAPEFIGLCYDFGHANMIRSGMDALESLKDRLIALHLHDNDGSDDQHKPLFSGTVDWERLAAIIAHSSYAKCISMEVSMRESGFSDERAFLAYVFKTGTQFAQMVERARAI